jgi:hypothetical protein
VTIPRGLFGGKPNRPRHNRTPHRLEPPLPKRARPAAGQLDMFPPRRPARLPTEVHWGLGADSTALLDMILDEPRAFGLLPDLSDCTILVAHTGNEWPDTLDLADEYILPRLREHGVRLVEIARGGPRDADGVAVLSDTRTPTALHRRGPWTLAEELEAAGTVPLRARGHRHCSLKFKGWPLDTWAAREWAGLPYRAAVGYNADEGGRALRDTAATVAGRIPWYPLIERRLARVDVEEHLFAQYGVFWGKSYCWLCPFPSQGVAREQHLARMRRFPDGGARSLWIEHVARVLNPNSTLRANSSLLDEVRAAPDTGAILDRFEALVRQAPTAVYEIRRILPAARSRACELTAACPDCRATAPYDETCPHSVETCGTCLDPRRRGRAWRSLRTLSTGSTADAHAHLRRLAAEHHAEPAVDNAGITRAVVVPRGDTFPTVEHLYAVGPAGPRDKERPGFASAWAAATGSVPALL